MFPSRYNKLAINIQISQRDRENGVFLQIHCFTKETPVFAETFKTFAIGQKSSKMVIALEGKPISAYHFRPFLLSLGPTYGQDITLKAIYKLVNLPS
jgi:hypothetical protein